jgi:hypothetical protein
MESGLCLHPMSEVKQKQSVMRTIISSFAILIISAFFMAAVQPRIVTGYVTDDQGNHLAGAKVYVKNTKRGTTTDLSGHYSISLQPGDKVLVFSFLGLETKEVNINEKKIINVKLYPEAKELEEVAMPDIPRMKAEKHLSAPVSYDMAAGSYTYSSVPPAYNPNFNTEGYATIHVWIRLPMQMFAGSSIWVSYHRWMLSG